MALYIVFAGEDHYPSPGWTDAKAVTLTFQDALDLAEDLRGTGRVEWVQVVQLDATFAHVARMLSYDYRTKSWYTTQPEDDWEANVLPMPEGWQS